MAKTSPIEFMNQVKAETAKVAWPTRRETLMTALMVVIMTSVLGVFFFLVDLVFRNVVRELLEVSVGGESAQFWWIGGALAALVVGYLLARKR